MPRRSPRSCGRPARCRRRRRADLGYAGPDDEPALADAPGRRSRRWSPPTRSVHACGTAALERSMATVAGSGTLRNQTGDPFFVQRSAAPLNPLPGARAGARRRDRRRDPRHRGPGHRRRQGPALPDQDGGGRPRGGRRGPLPRQRDVAQRDGIRHLNRLLRARALLRINGHATSRSVLACYGGAGCDRELIAAAGREHAVLVDVPALYAAPVGGRVPAQPGRPQGAGRRPRRGRRRRGSGRGRPR